MAKLRFYAREDRLVYVPGSRPATGDAPRYVGRGFVPGKDGAAPQYPAKKDPYECDADSDAGRRLIERVQNDVRDGYGAPLWPADKETAAACGVDFQSVSLVDGSWVAGAQPAKTKKASE